jgi:hypothetical protein
MFRYLSPIEASEFRAYADSHEPDLWTWDLAHPVCRLQWIRNGKASTMIAPFATMELATDEVAVIEAIKQEIGAA